MKKLAAISLLVLFLFNLTGYKLLTEYLENKADRQMQAKLDASDYDEDDLVTIKVASNLPPYTYNSGDFQNINGTINVNGINYNYVKLRYYNDTMELKCIANQEKTGIMNARDEFSKLANDFTNLTSKKVPGVPASKGHAAINSIGDYDDFCTMYVYQKYVSQAFHAIPHHIHTIKQRAILAPAQPPEC